MVTVMMNQRTKGKEAYLVKKIKLLERLNNRNLAWALEIHSEDNLEEQVVKRMEVTKECKVEEEFR